MLQTQFCDVTAMITTAPFLRLALFFLVIGIIIFSYSYGEARANCGNVYYVNRMEVRGRGDLVFNEDEETGYGREQSQLQAIYGRP
ncbi:unnamed protein product [Caenorhabditis auriculariae]|uniref:Uncharacterized protein n=1 Tax=Caenorhabditis auriculariae TaxID=2777116 RepID=A0A8S1H7Z6_9PELO|nr:unnamed protein product [Caenorhabditis auriculariae]